MNIKSIGSKIKGNPTMVEGTVYSMLIICSISHFLNDMIQSIIPSIYPIVKDKFDFSFAQIGIITLVFQMTSSILQPFTGLYADKHPRPYALSIGMCFTLVGLLLLAFAENYFLILLAVSVIGLGSSVFHPTASRVAQMASGGKKSLAQSIFQVGGNGGSAVGPLLAAIIILIAGIVPKFSGLLTTIPHAVLGGATIPVFASIAMTGIKLALSDGATPRNMAIVGLAVAMGMGLSAAPESLYLFPAWVTTIFGKAPVVLASMIAISLNLILPKRHGSPSESSSAAASD